MNSPASFEAELCAMKQETEIFKDPKAIDNIEFCLCFLSTFKEIEAFLETIKDKLKGDVILWLCYPKGCSKKYTCDSNREPGWASVAKYNLEPFRKVAIAKDWSALRFRKVEFIKSITRRESFAPTDEAKERTTQKGV